MHPFGCLFLKQLVKCLLQCQLNPCLGCSELKTDNNIAANSPPNLSEEQTNKLLLIKYYSYYFNSFCFYCTGIFLFLQVQRGLS